jgi:hypothetical protein
MSAPLGEAANMFGTRRGGSYRLLDHRHMLDDDNEGCHGCAWSINPPHMS